MKTYIYRIEVILSRKGEQDSGSAVNYLVLAKTPTEARSNLMKLLRELGCSASIVKEECLGEAKYNE